MGMMFSGASSAAPQPSLDQLLSQLFSGGSAPASQAPPQGAPQGPQPDIASVLQGLGITSNSTMATPPGSLVAQAPPAPTNRPESFVPQGPQPDMGAMGGAASQPPPAAPSPSDPMAAMPAPPQWKARNPIGDVLDRLFLGGAIEGVRGSEYKHQVESYQMALQRAQLARQMGAIGALPSGIPQALATLNPEKFAEEASKSVTTPGGDTSTFMGDPSLRFTAPKIGVTDPTSGVIGNATATGFTPTGQFGGGFKIDPSSGQVISDRSGLTGQSVPQFQKVGPGETGSFVSPGGAGVTGAAPVGAADPNAPRNVRNNNPGNLKALPGGRMWPGQTGTDSAGYAVFGSADAGQAAGMTNVQTYAKRGINTVARAIGRWAPQADGNNTGAYASFVARQLGVGPQDKIDLSDPATASKFFQAVTQYEGGPRGGSITARRGMPSSLQGKSYTDLPDGSQRAPTGKLETGPQTWTPANTIELRNSTLKSDQFSNYSTASQAYNALVSLAKAPQGGIRAYAARDLAARIFNPGAVTRVGTLEALAHAQGIPANIQAYFSNLKGDGDVPPQIMQQLVDAAQYFARGHYNEAKAVNDAASGVAQRHGLNPADVIAPLGDAPERYDMKTGRYMPDVGAVKGGYRYNGGDPHNKASWSKVQ